MEKDTYDRKAAGIRIREKRRQLGITMKEAAEKLGRVPTYYADIEGNLRDVGGNNDRNFKTVSYVTGLSDSWKRRWQDGRRNGKSAFRRNRSGISTA